MGNYKIVRKGIFESLKSFEERINGLHAGGWKAVSMSVDNARVCILMERQR